MLAPDPALVARFVDDLTAAFGRSLDGNETLALAVSGGADSMAMLALAHAAFPGRVIAATVDHGLRAESANEAAMVASYCMSLGITHATLAPDAPIARANLQANARAARYHLLERWAATAGARLLLTAHHADDQAETLLMRIARGSGVAGLAGIRARQWIGSDPTALSPPAEAGPLALVRPLLGWRRAELRALIQAMAVPFVDDPSNVDPHYDRVRFRALLAATPALDPAQLARSAAYVAEADEALRAFERWLWQTRKAVPTDRHNPSDHIVLDLTALPRELTRRLARVAIEECRLMAGITRPEFTASTNIEPLLDALEQGKTATQAGILVTPKGTIWRFSKAPPRRSH